MEIKEYIRKDIKFIKIKNDLNMEMTFSNLGAAIYSIYIDKDIMTLSPKSIIDFKKKKLYYGKNIGPICSRILNGKVSINKQDFYLKCNVFGEKNFALHGGEDGYSALLYDYKIIVNEKEIILSFFKYIKETKINYPADVDIAFIYKIKRDKNQFELITNLICSHDAIFSLTNHTYFSLFEKSLKNLSLYINASNHVLLDSVDSLPIKEEGVNDVIDFRKEKNIFKDFQNEYLQNSSAKGYDHNYILDNNGLKNLALRLKGRKYYLDIYTTFDGIHIYTCNYSDNIDYINNDKGLYKGIAIEPQIPLSRRKVTRKNTKLSYKTIYKFNLI